MSSAFVHGPDYTGQTINGRWKILYLIGIGGFGAVYAARDRLRRHSSVVLKFEYAHSEQEVDEVRRSLGEEWRNLRHLNRVAPNLPIPTVYENGTHNGTKYIAMTRFGASIEEWLEDREGPASNYRILHITYQIYNIIRCMHQEHIAHGDISERNILFGRNRNDRQSVYAIDLGNSGRDDESIEMEDLGELCHVMVKMFRNGVDGLVPDQHRGGVFWISLSAFQRNLILENLEKAFDLRKSNGVPIPDPVRTLVNYVVSGDEIDYSRISRLLRRALREAKAQQRR
ncbi:Protein kinase [Gracilaria domingensis]|nr:Protein kinase [Gracilaria domingensis]